MGLSHVQSNRGAFEATEWFPASSHLGKPAYSSSIKLLGSWEVCYIYLVHPFSVSCREAYKPKCVG